MVAPYRRTVTRRAPRATRPARQVEKVVEVPQITIQDKIIEVLEPKVSVDTKNAWTIFAHSSDWRCVARSH